VAALPIKHGATSIWERWSGWTPETGFGDPGMDSFAHYSFGAVYQWMVENIAGIRNDAHSSPHAPREVHSSQNSLHHAERDDYYIGARGVAYKKIVIVPTPGGKLTSADVRYDSIRGRIESAWKKIGDKLTLNVTIPANTTATVFVSAKSADAITESGKPLMKAPGVKFLRMDGDRAVLDVEAGSYEFGTTAKQRRDPWHVPRAARFSNTAAFGKNRARPPRSLGTRHPILVRRRWSCVTKPTPTTCPRGKSHS